MDKETHPDTEALRATLQALERKQVKALCESAVLSLSTVTKFRAGLIKELGYAKSHALTTAIAGRKNSRRNAKQAA